MTDATCKTCQYSKAYTQTDGTTLANLECRRHCPVVAQEITMAQRYVNPCIGIWPDVQPDDWCGEHPDRQQREYAEATIVTHDDDGPSAADMHRIVDALEKMAHCAAVKL